MTWLYNNQPVETLPEDCVGFVYIITNITTDRKYIGKKLAKFSKTTQKTVKLKNGTKKKKKIRTKVDSDWQDYYGSSPELTKDVESQGKDTSNEKYFITANLNQNAAISKQENNFHAEC